VTTLRVFWLDLSILLSCEWWGRRFLNHSNIEAVLNKRLPGDSPQKTNQSILFLIIAYLWVDMRENLSSYNTLSPVIRLLITYNLSYLRHNILQELHLLIIQLSKYVDQAS